MHYIKKLNENYYIYIILIFVFIPISFLPQLFGGTLIEYAYETGDISALDNYYRERGRYFHLPFFYLVDFLAKYTLIPAGIFLDILITIFLILFCIEVKKYSKLLFNLENKWCNLAALFTAIFPVWHILVDFDIGLYLISFYFALFGYRKFTEKKKINIIIGLIFIFISFTTQSNLTFVIGLATIFFLLNKSNSAYNFSFLKLTTIVVISFFYFFLRKYYFTTSGMFAGYNEVTLFAFQENLTAEKLIKNILNYSTYLFLFIWIALLFIFYLLFKNLSQFSMIKSKLKNVVSYKHFNHYILLIILSGFAIFPYLLVNKSSSILYLADYYQRHALLLASIFGLFFSLMFRDLSKINCLQHKVNLNFYITIFICFNLLLLNYGSYRKTESHLFQKNLIDELKTFGSIPIGNVELISKNIPADLRTYELSYLFYKAYNIAGWWIIPKPVASFNLPSNMLNPPSNILNDNRYSNLNIIKDYKYGCITQIYLKNSLRKYQRIKQFYVFKYKKYYNIDKIEKKC